MTRAAGGKRRAKVAGNGMQAAIGGRGELEGFVRHLGSINVDLDDDPSLVNSDPYGAGWMIRLKVSDPAQISSLLAADGYAEHIG